MKKIEEYCPVCKDYFGEVDNIDSDGVEYCSKECQRFGWIATKNEEALLAIEMLLEKIFFREDNKK